MRSAANQATGQCMLQPGQCMRDAAMISMMLRNAHGLMNLLAGLVHVTKRGMQRTETQRCILHGWATSGKTPC